MVSYENDVDQINSGIYEIVVKMARLKKIKRNIRNDRICGLNESYGVD